MPSYLILRGFCLGPGLGDTAPDEERNDIPEHMVSRLMAQGKIRAIPEPAQISQAEVLAAAHSELLAKIAAAATVTALEELLSEDPEIVAAYEKRMAELEAEAGAKEAKQIMKGLKKAGSEAEAVALISTAATTVGLNLLKSEISEQETALHAAIAARLADLDEPHH